MTALPVNTRTVGRLNELSTELLEVAESVFAAGYRGPGVDVQAAASLAVSAANKLLDAIVAQRDAMLKDDEE